MGGQRHRDRVFRVWANAHLEWQGDRPRLGRQYIPDGRSGKGRRRPWQVPKYSWHRPRAQRRSWADHSNDELGERVERCGRMVWARGGEPEEGAAQLDELSGVQRPWMRGADGAGDVQMRSATIL